MRFKNRKGSTLALTIMIFAVLMIFATFTLGFMVTENKQAMYHQNKTQAYYIARSGAEIVEEAILEIAKNEDKTDANNLLNQIPLSQFYNPISLDAQLEVELSDDIKPSNGLMNIYLSKEMKGDNYASIIITSVAEVGGVKVELQKELPTPLSLSAGTVVAGINYITPEEEGGISPAVAIWEGKKISVSQVNADDYPVEEINPPTFNDLIEKRDNNEIMISELGGLTNISSGNYYVDGNLSWDDHNIYIDGEVNIYIKGYMNITDLEIDGDINSELNVYIYGEEEFSGESLFTEDKSTNSISGDVKTKFYIASGDIYLNFFQGKNQFFDADIYAGSGVDIIELNAHSNSGHPNMIGKIYAPKSKVIIGSESGDDQASFSLEGSILADKVEYKAKNNQYNQLGKKFQINTTGIDQDEANDTMVLLEINDGYYR